MVNSIGNNNGQITALARANAVGAPIPFNAQTPPQTLVAKLANNAQPTTVQPSFKAEGSDKGETLPRGSIVDVLA